MPRRTGDIYFLSAATVTDPATNTQLGDLIQVDWIDDWLLYVKATGATGAGATVTLQVQGSINRTNWVPLKTWTAITGATYEDDATVRATPPPTRYEHLRLVATAKAGTTPALQGVTAGIFAKGYS